MTQQQPRSSFAALTAALGVNVLRQREAQIQAEVQATGRPEWQVREEHYRAREAERQATIEATNQRVAELRDPRLRHARERAEAQAAAREQAMDRLARWADYCQTPHYDAFGHVRDNRADEPPAWFT